MQPVVNQPNLGKLSKEWADIAIQVWKRNLTRLNIGQKGQLFDSFQFFIRQQSGGTIQSIDFEFLAYGRFVDMGVGKDVPIGNPGNVTTKRKRKPWYSKSIWHEIKRLREILEQQLGKNYADRIVAALEQAQSKDLKS